MSINALRNRRKSSSSLTTVVFRCRILGFYFLFCFVTVVVSCRSIHVSRNCLAGFWVRCCNWFYAADTLFCIIPRIYRCTTILTRRDIYTVTKQVCITSTHHVN